MKISSAVKIYGKHAYIHTSHTREEGLNGFICEKFLPMSACALFAG